MKKILIFCLAGTLSMASVYAMDNVSPKTSEKVVEKSKSIQKQATSAMEDTRQALTRLEQNEKKEAQKLLTSATGKLEMVVAREPSLGLAPFDVRVTTNSLVGTVDDVKKFKEEAIKALQDGKVQEARAILANLRSDTVVSVANIPLATYPAALKDAVKLIDQNKIEEARSIITNALSAVVITETLFPLPIAKAEFYIDEATKLSSKKDRSKSENQALMDFIKEGRTSLQMAEVLGYVPKDEFKDLYAKLDDASNDAKDGKTGNWFQEAKKKISNFFSREDSNKKQSQEEKE